MIESDEHSRINKFDKRRKNTKLISIFLIAGALLVIILLGIWFFGGGSDEAEEDSTTNEENSSDDFLVTEEDDSEQESNENADQEKENDASEDESENEENQEDEVNEDAETKPAEPSDDNVSDAYTGDWEPVGTEQEGPHTTNFDDGSQDRVEIRSAASQATGINEADMVEWWVENGGDQKVIATVSDKAETETYRVFLSWIDGKGWQTTKVEALIENDKK